MSGAAVTGAFVMAATGAFYLLEDRFAQYGRLFIRVGVVAGLVFSVMQIFPTGDLQGKYMAAHQPTTTAAMEGLFKSESGASIVLMGQPDENQQRIDNPIVVQRVLSFLIYGTTAAEVRGLNEFPKENWPSNIPLLFYCYHIMAGLGTWFVALMGVAAMLLWKGRLFHAKWVLWPMMLSFPLPYIANTAGWLTAEIGRQPWLVYGLMRTENGSSKYVSAGNTMFTLLGFMGLYTVLSVLFVVLVYREIDQGPDSEPAMALDSYTTVHAG